MSADDVPIAHHAALVVDSPPATYDALPEGVELLNGGYVRRLPTRADLASRHPLALTARDLDVLVAIHKHGFLTARLIDLAFFPPVPTERTAAGSAASRRLRQLWLWRLIERVERPVARALRGSEPYLYALGRQGAPLVAQRMSQLGEEGVLSVHARRLDRLSPWFVDHDLNVARVWAHTAAALRDVGVDRWTWIGETELRARKLHVEAPNRRNALPFLPDGYFEITYRLRGPTGSHAPAAHPRAAPVAPGDGSPQQCCLVEIDRGTETLDRFRLKVQAFELGLENGLFAREFQRQPFEVLVITTSEKRLNNLRQATLREVRPSRRAWYSFATLDILHPARFGGPCWLTLDGERVALFYDCRGASGAVRAGGDLVPAAEGGTP